MAEPLKSSHLGSDVWVYPNALTPELCAQVVELYDVTEPKIQRGGIYDNRECEFLYISGLPAWSVIDLAIAKVVHQVMDQHYTDYGSPGSYKDEGYQVCCYEPGEVAVEHVDGAVHPHDKSVRLWSVAAYFNNFDAGEVIFPRQDLSLTPEIGMVALWPPHMSHPHKTLPSKVKRYSMITWSGPQSR